VEEKGAEPPQVTRFKPANIDGVNIFRVRKKKKLLTVWLLDDERNVVASEATASILRPIGSKMFIVRGNSSGRRGGEVSSAAASTATASAVMSSSWTMAPHRDHAKVCRGAERAEAALDGHP